MQNFGFIKVGAAIPSVHVGDVDYNIEQLKRMIDKAVKEGVEILSFPELCVTGYTCQDLFRNGLLLDRAEKALDALADYTKDLPIVVIVGAPLRQMDRLYNSAVVVSGGDYYTVNKTYIPNYAEFYESRWFAGEESASMPTLFTLPSGVTFAIEVCEDVWAPLPPSSNAAVAGADLIFNLSATNELVGKHDCLLTLLSEQSRRCAMGYVYASVGCNESSQDLVFGGNALIFEGGELLARSERFSCNEQLITAQVDIEHLRASRCANSSFRQAQGALPFEPTLIPLEVAERVAPLCLERSYTAHPFIPTSERSVEEIVNIQVLGLAQRLRHTGIRDIVIGVSGGLDSTLALLVCVATFDKLGLSRSGIHGITMPGLGSSSRTYDNALALMSALNISSQDIPISAAVAQHFKDISHDPSLKDSTYENAQARYRTMVLMDIANAVGGIVVGTGDLSELALGWCTYNGDHMSMYAVNSDIPKTLVQHIVRTLALRSTPTTQAILLDIVATPISPELTPPDEQGVIAQETEAIIGPYELHDFFIYHFLRSGFAPQKLLLLAESAFGDKYDSATIKKYLRIFLKRFFVNQFKRSCMPDGPKVVAVSLSPRGDWRMASDASVEQWLRDLDDLDE